MSMCQSPISTAQSWKLKVYTLNYQHHVEQVFYIERCLYFFYATIVLQEPFLKRLCDIRSALEQSEFFRKHEVGTLQCTPPSRFSESVVCHMHVGDLTLTANCVHVSSIVIVRFPLICRRLSE